MLEQNAVAEAKKVDSGVRRTRLREFQTQLVERMQAAQRGAHTKFNQLGIVIGSARYLLDLRESGEIVSAGAFSPVPLTKEWYLGLANVRGNLTGVIDLPRFQGLESTRFESSSRVVAFAQHLAFNNGLLVSQVLGLRSSEEMQELVRDSADADFKPWLRKKFQDKDGQIWYELSLADLILDQDFLHIGI